MTNGSSKSTSQRVRDGIEDAADTAAATLRQEAEKATDAATSHAEEEVSSAANAAAAASGQFEPGSLQAQAADHVAASLHQVAGALRNTDLNQAAGQVTRFARENPALFLGGAALLGFAATRFLKSSDPAPRVTARADTDPWTGHVTATPAVAAEHPAAHSGDPMSRGYTNGSARS